MAETTLDLVMLVDDNPTDNFISKKVLELTGFAKQVIEHSSGKSALEYLEANADNDALLPNLIFLDINMPIVDGFVFLYDFEQFPESIKKKCQVIVLSSSDNKKDIDKIITNDFVIKFITKPLDVPKVLELKSFFASSSI